MTFTVVPTSESHIEGFSRALESVAREKKYLPFVIGDPIDITRAFVIDQLKKENPHFVALSLAKIVTAPLSGGRNVIFEIALRHTACAIQAT